MKVLGLDDWIEAAKLSLVESAGVLLEMEARLSESTTAYPTTDAEDRWGTLLPFHADAYSLHLGLMSSTEGCRALTEALVGPGDWTNEDIADAVGEIVNVMAGQIHGALVDRDNSIDFGFPIVMQGHLIGGRAMESAVVAADIGGIDCDLLVLMAAFQAGKVN